MKSMDSIDASNRKPRRFKGTPAYTLRNQITVAVIAYSLVAGALCMFAPISRNIWNALEVLATARRQELEDTTPEESLKNNSILRAYTSILTKHQRDFVEKTNEKSGQ